MDRAGFSRSTMLWGSKVDYRKPDLGLPRRYILWEPPQAEYHWLVQRALEMVVGYGGHRFSKSELQSSNFAIDGTHHRVYRHMYS